MGDLGFYLWLSVGVYCTALIYMQKVNIDFHRDEETKRLKDRVRELESQQEEY
jgi:heme exporter protein D